MRGLIALLVVLGAGVALAEDPAQKRAREELEKQLNQMVGKAPCRVRVEFQPVDDPNFRVEELELAVDGKPLKAPTPAAVAAWVQDGPMPVGAVDVSPGRHKVTAKVTIHNTASALVTDEGDSRWKVAGDVGFDVNAGIEVKVIVTAVRDPKQAEVGKRIKLTFPSQPVMIATLDDGKMPEPSKLKPAPTPEQIAAEEAAAKKAAEEAAKVAAAEEAKTKAAQAAEAKKAAAEQAVAAKAQAAEEKKRKAEEAKLAKAQAAEERKQKAAEAKAAKLAAAEEKKRKAEEAKLAKVQAAEEAKAAAAEKKRLEEEAKLAALQPKVEPPAVAAADAGPAVAVAEAPVDAGAVAVAEPPSVIDAGLAVAAVAPVEPKVEPAKPASSDGPWILIGGGIGLVVLGVIIVLVRRAGRVPELKD